VAEIVPAVRAPERYDRKAHRYDAVLVVSFGGPEGPEDVMPFLGNVLAGLKLPPPAIKGIARRYEAFGGVSPINRHTRDFVAALQNELYTHGLDLPVYLGNRNWHPYLSDIITRMRADGIERAAAFVTSVFSSYSGCRRYREDLYGATAAVAGAPQIDKLRYGYNHPGFIAAVSARLSDAFARIPADRRAATPLVFTAHSLPESMAAHAPYQAQLREAAGLAAAALGHERWELAYQSNNASYGEPWLAPRLEDLLEQRAKEGVEDIVVAPIGFVCDHMEVVLDLDVDAQKIAKQAGINMLRAATVGSHPAYVAMVRELIEERITPSRERRALGQYGPSHDFCAPDCCLSGRSGAPQPSLCSAPSAVEA